MFLNKKMIWKLIAISLIFGVFFIWRVGETSMAAGAEASNVYLPLVFKNYPKPISIFGMEILENNVGYTVNFAKDANVTWVRYNGILWNDVEPVPVSNPNDYDWSALATFETEILTLREQGITPMVIIRSTPEWARFDEYPDHICGPIRQDALDDFAEFVSDMVKKYSQPPYEVRYWEIGNEPDVHPELFTVADSSLPYGCWGNVNDPYYGGGWYADMLKSVYPAIKRADPGANVVLGGLLLVCDPGVPGKEQDCLAAKYLEGILRNGGGDYFDIIAYHSYPYWFAGYDSMDWDLNQFLWAHRGGVLIGKLSFIQEVMSLYNVQKPILMNEGGLMCAYTSTHPDYDECFTDAYKQAKANYVIRMYARSGSLDLIGSAWFTLNGPGWRQGGLLDGVTTTPAYEVYMFLANKLGEPQYLQKLSQGTLEGYEYLNPATMKKYQIYWSNNSQTFSIFKPANTIAVYEQDGSIVPDWPTITVGFDPVIIEINP